MAKLIRNELWSLRLCVSMTQPVFLGKTPAFAEGSFLAPKKVLLSEPTDKKQLTHSQAHNMKVIR